jgi:TonB family protein
MTESVTDIVVARASRRDSMTPMVIVSVVAHAAVFVVLALMSLNAASAPPPKVFTISFAGSEGTRTGGLNPIGNRAVETVAPPEPKKNVEPPPPPTPKMVLPDPKPVRKRTPETTTARVEPPATKPPVATGDEVRPGTTTTETNVRGSGFNTGLSSGGGPSSGVQLDVSNFCCPDYLAEMITRIKQSWKKDLGRRGTVIVRFTIRRDGSIDSDIVEQSSGAQPLDFEARRAVQRARLEQLPGKFTGDQLTVHLTFLYE